MWKEEKMEKNTWERFTLGHRVSSASGQKLRPGPCTVRYRRAPRVRRSGRGERSFSALSEH